MEVDNHWFPYPIIISFSFMLILSTYVLTGINIGEGLPRAMTVAGVPITSIGDLEGYGVMKKLDQEKKISYLMGDFNVDLLKADSDEKISEYSESL